LALTLAGKFQNGWHFLLSTAHSAIPMGATTSFAIGPLTVPSLVMKIPGVRRLYSAGPFAFTFMLGLLQAQWTYTGYDASAHMAEETFLARMNTAWGVFLSVAVSAVVGYIALLALTNSIPPGKIAETVNDPYPVLYIVRSSLRPFFANVIAVTIVGAMWLCGLASITSMARVCYAFGRDGGLPGSYLVSRVSPKWGTPVVAIIVTSLLVVIVTFYSATYAVVTSMSTTALYLAYVIPILLNYRNKRRQSGEFTTLATAPWSLGRYGLAINLVSIVWVVFITLLFSIPPNELAGLTMLGLGVLLLLYWQLSQKRRFRGPRTGGPVEIEKAEAELSPRPI